MIGWVALGLLVALVASLAIGARRMWTRQRTDDEDAAWREVAAEIGHAYSTADVPHELDHLPLPLLGRIDADVVAPELTGPSEGGIQRLFMTSIDGRIATVGVADLARPVPACSLRPSRSAGPHVGAAWDPVDPGLADLTARFEVRGPDAEAIRAFLAGEIGGWLAEGDAEWSIEMAGSQVLVARSELQVEQLGEVAAALDAFRARLPWALEAGRKRPADAGSATSGDTPSPKRKRRRRRGRGGGSGSGDRNGNAGGSGQQ